VTAEPTTVYTDGACKGNPGPGGWGWVVPGGRSSSGGELLSTNQRMELSAVLDALRELPGAVIVVSDSTYVVNCFRDGWWKGWIKRGWRNSKKEPVANRDLWEPLIELYRDRADEIEFRWVKGHAGNEWNEQADQLAVEAAQAQAAAPTGSPDASSPDDQGDRTGQGRGWLPSGRSVAAFGAQPPDLGGYEDNPVADAARHRLVEVFAAKREMNPDLTVLTGLRLGVETLAAEAAIEVGTPFVVVLPFPDPDARWPVASRRRFADLRDSARSVVLLDGTAPSTPQKAGQALSRRNTWMARVADESVVVWNRSDPWLARLVLELEREMPDDVWHIDI